jgi:uncharacterized protein YukE
MLLPLQLAEMRALAERNVDASDKTQSELRNSRKRIDELSSEVSRLTAQVSVDVVLHCPKKACQ